MYKIQCESTGIYNYKVYREDRARFSQPIARTITKKSATILCDGFNDKLQTTGQCQT